MAPLPSRVIRTAAVAGVATVLLTACTWRVETPPIPSRTPTPTVVLRDEAALREQAVIDAADSTDLGVIEAGLAPERLAALGGVYVEYPSASPTPDAGVSAAPSLDEAVQDAIDEALAAADAAAEDDPGLSAMLRSIALSHALAVDAPGVTGTAPVERAMPGIGDDATGPWAPDEGTAVDGDTLAALAVAHDRASFAYEVAAARASGNERTRALKRSRLHEERVAELLALPGVEDLRTSLYDVPPAGTENRRARAATERAVETGLAESYAALIDGAEPADVPWILNSAYDAWMRAAALPGFDLGSLPALPGLDVS
ncbi:hypothetical protein QQX09_07425 [Demequina sp. SYSU T00192]|uniref:DUF4439 domain-containing protein n=1 Tax=Demequina litoralis TaxID=3051660 RepID=A0ABT8G966_9MICO|nr:hypothetical protein [Demequina sp. SYSU T00192]MDN4475682.1 hypothetical protein [Demequina sp. SYSU T00192]